MPRLPQVSGKETIQALKKIGFIVIHQTLEEISGLGFEFDIHRTL